MDFTGQTPFLTAALAGDVTVMRLLLEHGADPHITTVAGTTALMAAAGINWIFYQTSGERPEEVVRSGGTLLLARDGRERGQLDGADGAPRRANRGSDDIIRFLVDKGAKLDVKDKEGRSPLTWAEGVFLATHPSRPKPSSIALIETLSAR